jgi:hypothetical protein
MSGNKPQPLAPSQPIDWLRVREVAGNAFDRAKFFYFADGERHPEMMLALAREVSKLREYAIADPAELRPFWDTLRESQTIVDLLMDVTAEVTLLTGYAYNDLAMQYAKATHAAIPRTVNADQLYAASSNITDAAFLDSVAREDHFRMLLSSNPWLLIVLVLKQIGKFNAIQPARPPVHGDPATGVES